MQSSTNSLIKIYFWFIFLILISCVITISHATIANVIHFQGFLKRNNGDLIQSGQHLVTFSLFDNPEEKKGTPPIWTESHFVTVKNGLYSVQLGSIVPFADPDENPNTSNGLSFAIPYYLGIKIGQDDYFKVNGKFLPLTSVWYAFRSNTTSGRLIRFVNQNYEITDQDDIILASDNCMITLPLAVKSPGRHILIKKIDAAPTTLSILTQPTEVIKGIHFNSSEDTSSYIMSNMYQELALVSYKNSWYRLGHEDMGQDIVTPENIMNHIDDGAITYPKLDIKNAIQSNDIHNKTLSLNAISAQQLTVNQIISSTSAHIQSLTIGNKSFRVQPASESVDITIPNKEGTLVISKTGKISQQELLDNAVETQTIQNKTIMNEDISDSAQIEYHKLVLHNSIHNQDIVNGAINTEKIKDRSILNKDISYRAGIAYHKLSLTDSIQTDDIKDQAISAQKLKNIQSVGDKDHLLVSDGQDGFLWKKAMNLIHVYIVGEGGEYSRINDALQAVNATKESPCLIKVGPGVYKEQIWMKPYVDIEGSGENVTIVWYDGGNAFDPTSATVIGDSHSELRHITIESVVFNNEKTDAIGIINPNASSNLYHVTVHARGGKNYNYGVCNVGAHPKMSHMDIEASQIDDIDLSWNYGVYNDSASPIMTDLKIAALGGDRSYGVVNKDKSSPIMTNVLTIGSGGNIRNRGIWNESSSPYMVHVTAKALGNSFENTGIENYNSSSPILIDVHSEADGDTGYGIYQWIGENTKTKIYRSFLIGTTNSIFVTHGSAYIVNSELNGSTQGETKCLQSFTDEFIPLNINCHEKSSKSESESESQ